MFNDLTGATQYVGNWPGVTVEKKEGKFKGDREVTITDLPGIYSLSPYTLEEVVARDYLVNEKPDAIMNLVDASNIERNLYLSTQLLEMGIPVVIALNMVVLPQFGLPASAKRIDMFVPLSRQRVLTQLVHANPYLKKFLTDFAVFRTLELSKSNSQK